MWPTRRPLTVVACKVLVKTASESSTRSISDIIGFYESLVVFKAAILLEMRLGVRSTVHTGTCSRYRHIVRIGRCCRWGDIRRIFRGSLPLEFSVFCFEPPQIAE